jgi:hypothetical protein
MRSKMVKILDKFYFKELTDDEFNSKLEAAVKVIPSMKTIDEVSNLMAEE